ncbi:MAG TPA: hypothetical protein DDY31_01430, partial [Lachnospiraceae bacterium]|nr:hypothetical protein [Lachnospiraceae bacterium]
MMKKKWSKASIFILLLSLLLTGNTGTMAAAQSPFLVAEDGRTELPLFPGETVLPEISAEPVDTPEPSVTPEPTEEPYDDISLVQVSDYTSTTLTLSWFS